MNKLFAVIISAIMVVSLGITASAAEAVTEPSGNRQIDVQAKAVYISPENMYTEIVSGGNASVTTQNGTQISVSSNGTTLNGLMLNVTEIVSSDKEAYSWISGIMSGLCDKFTVYDIYFTDKDGNRAAVTEGATVSITTPDGYTNIYVYHIGESEKPQEIASEQSSGNTIFTATEFGYYVLAEKTNDGGTTDPAKPDNQDSPKTNDIGNITLWVLLLFVSGGVLTTLCMTTKRKKTGNK